MKAAESNPPSLYVHHLPRMDVSASDTFQSHDYKESEQSTVDGQRWASGRAIDKPGQATPGGRKNTLRERVARPQHPRQLSHFPAPYKDSTQLHSR